MAEVTAGLLMLGNIYLRKNMRFHLFIPLTVCFQGLNKPETLLYRKSEIKKHAASLSAIPSAGYIW